MQGYGIASQLLKIALPALRAKGYSRVWCDVRVSAREFYARSGFALDDAIFQKNGRAYVRGVRALD